MSIVTNQLRAVKHNFYTVKSEKKMKFAFSGYLLFTGFLAILITCTNGPPQHEKQIEQVQDNTGGASDRFVRIDINVKGVRFVSEGHPDKVNAELELFNAKMRLIDMIFDKHNLHEVNRKKFMKKSFFTLLNEYRKPAHQYQKGCA